MAKRGFDSIQMLLDEWLDVVGNEPGNPAVDGDTLWDQLRTLDELLDKKELQNAIGTYQDALKVKAHVADLQGLDAATDIEHIAQFHRDAKINQLTDAFKQLLAERRIGEWLLQNPVARGPKSKQLSKPRTNNKLPKWFQRQRAPDYRRLAGIPKRKWRDFLADGLKQGNLSRNSALDFAKSLTKDKKEQERKTQFASDVAQFDKQLTKLRKDPKSKVCSIDETKLFRFEQCSFLDLDLTLAPARKGEKPKAVISDPPYLKNHVFDERDKSGKLVKPSLIRLFARWCNTVLAKNGIVAGMFGAMWTNEVIRIFESEGFEWRWTITTTYEGGFWARIMTKKVLACSKPILLFHRKGEMGGKHILGDVIRCGRRDKRFFVWQQDVETFEQLVATITDPGDLVVDPFAATGTTGIACLNLKRRFIGSEIDPKTYKTGLYRLQKCVYEGETWRMGYQEHREPPTFDDKGNLVWGKKIEVAEEIAEDGNKKTVKE